MSSSHTDKGKVRILLFFILLTALASLSWILWSSFFSHRPSSHTDSSSQVWADIYQDGIILQSIPLSSVSEAYTITVTNSQGAENVIGIRPGSIGILSATCPDKLCVRQGFIESSLLPITCLPNHLVIQLRVENTVEQENVSEESDILTYG